MNGKKYQILKIEDAPQWKQSAAEWFHSKWKVPVEAYLESMEQSFTKEKAVPAWYLCLDGEKIIGGMGVIENDFHNRKDLSPNVCAVYTEEAYRCQGIAGDLLHYVCTDMQKKGIFTLYLLTDHTSFYERYGWEYLCPVMGDGEETPSRMYVHKTKMPLYTERLYLREMVPQDFEALYAVLDDPDTMRHYSYRFDEARVKNWIKKNTERYRELGFGLWAVCLRENDEMIGDCGLTLQNINGKLCPEIGYHIRKDCRRKGYAKEAASAVRDWTFCNTPFGKVYSYMKSENSASVATACSYGCGKEGEYTDGEGEQTVVYALTKAQWEEQSRPLRLWTSHCVFPCNDICKTAEFYEQKLGFRRVDYFNATEPHSCLYRDSVELILTQAKGTTVVSNHARYGYGGDAYIIVKNQLALQEEYRAKGVRLIQELHKTDYHNREFVIEDIDGRWLYFGIKE